MASPAPRLRLPGTELHVSRLALGTAHFGIKQDEVAAHDLLSTYVSWGGNFIDTARVYSDWVPGETGRSERIIGDWLRADPTRRSRVVIGTKGLHYRWSDKARSRVASAHAREDIEASLQAMGIATIDLYWLHRDNPALRPEEIIEFMQVYVEEGKVRHLGVANWAISRLQSANAHAARHGLHPFVANQPLFNLGSWDLPSAPDPTLVTLDRAAYTYHRTHPFALIPYSAQAQGYFSRCTAGQTPRPKRYDSPRNHAVAQLAGKLARELDVPVSAIVLAYLTHQPLPIVPIIGPNSVIQLGESFASLDVSLSPAALNLLEEACGSGLRHRCCTADTWSG